MLSYRHAFHAGNHADVLKHIILVQLLAYMTRKDKPCWYIDTHAGGALYALDAGYATQLEEFRDGVGRLWPGNDPAMPAAVADYLALVTDLNHHDTLQAYPGSPWLAHKLLREQDRLRLFELHSTEAKTLQDNFREGGRQVLVTAGDGFAGLKALLPPPPRRAVVLIDPSYETRQDYVAVVHALKDGIQRFATGTYAVWYPMLVKMESRQLPDKLKMLAPNWLHASLQVREASRDGLGMHGSGMFIINPPWTLAQTLAEVLPYLVEKLGQDHGARFTLEHQGD